LQLSLIGERFGAGVCAISGKPRAAAVSTRLREGGRRKRQECEPRVERRRARFAGNGESAPGPSVVPVVVPVVVVVEFLVVFGTVIPLSAK
jgi:hypothetical protein